MVLKLNKVFMQIKIIILMDSFIYVLVMPTEQKLTITEGKFILAFLCGKEVESTLVIR